MKNNKFLSIILCIITLVYGISIIYLFQLHRSSEPETVLPVSQDSSTVDLIIGTTDLHIDLSSLEQETFELMESAAEIPMPVSFSGAENLKISINDVPIENPGQIVIDSNFPHQ